MEEHGRIIGKCIEVFGDMMLKCLWRLCKLCSFYKRLFSYSWEIMESERTSMLKPKFLCKICEEGICTCSSIVFLKTNKIGPHWSWTRRRSPGGVNSVIICCLQISWFVLFYLFMCFICALYFFPLKYF